MISDNNNNGLDNEKLDKSQKNDSESVDMKKELFSWARSIIIILIFSFLFLKVFTNARIPSSSMETTIMTGDRLFGYNFAYKDSTPSRGDIIIFRMPDEPHEIYIKRVIGIAGDNISFTLADANDGNQEVKVVRNGEILDEPYINEPMKALDDLELSFDVPEGSVFVMGDNRNNSFDGRYWENHFVTRDAVIAKAIFRYWPLQKMGVVD